MKVFIPHHQDKNIYLDEIIRYSSFEYIFGDYKEFKLDFQIVNIQFPEAIFDWKAPSKKQLIDLEDRFLIWKKHAKIVYTMNDFSKHYDNDELFLELFKLVHKYADGVIHLGEFSLKKYKKYFSSYCLHTVIHHPIYFSLLGDYKTNDIQEIVPFDLHDKYIVSAIGSIRSREEMKIVVDIFKKLTYINKVLIVPRMSQFIKIPSYIPYSLRKTYKKIVGFIDFYSIRDNQCYFGNKFMEYPFLVDLVQKSSLMIIPRIKNLNSGNLFLGITFDKNMIVPKTGNLTEVLSMFKIPSFNFKQYNKQRVMDFVSSLEKEKYFEDSDYEQKKETFHPREIAKKQDVFFILISK